jgi:organic hydroperoxide reductase OsmC/OhrA
VVRLTSDKLPALETAAPAEFDGPGDRWSPETLLVAAVADCFALTFRAVARASKLEWKEVRCSVDGTLDRTEGRTRFVSMSIRATAVVPEGEERDRAVRALEKAERGCLITNSLALTPTFEAIVEVG